MIHANEIRINKYKSKYIIQIIGVYIHQKRKLTANNISTKTANIKWAQSTVVINTYVNE